MSSDKSVRISFYELVRLPDVKRDQQVDWDKVLANLESKLADEDYDNTVDHNGKTLDGVVYNFEGEYCLSLAIDRDIHPRQRTRRERRTLAPMETWEAAEESIVVFFDRNIFGILGSGMGAPSSSAVSQWLNKFAPLNSGDELKLWNAVPIVRNDVYEKILKSRNLRFSTGTFAFKPENLRDGEEGGILTALAERFDSREGFTVEVTIRAGRKKAKKINSAVIEAQVEDWVTRPEIEKLKVTAEPEGGRLQEFDLLEHHLAYRVEVPVESFNDSDTLAPLANEEIRRGFDELSSAILAAVPNMEG